MLDPGETRRMGNSQGASDSYSLTGENHTLMLPDELLEDILSFLSFKDIKNCALVCKHWSDVICSHQFWRKVCDRKGCLIPHVRLDSIPEKYYRTIALKNAYGRNLIKNSGGKDILKAWSISQEGGNGWTVEKPPAGCEPIPPEANEESCFATSYGMCVKEQMIDLLKEGVHKEILDEIKPDIEITEWHAARFDCGSTYELRVALLDQSTKTLLDTFTFGPFLEDQWTGRNWSCVKHTFSGYPKGLRYILFQHRGCDTQFWLGHYGSKMTGASVRFKFSH